MSMILTALAAIAFSAGPILLLCIHDPKRRRSTGAKSGGMTSRQRRIFVIIACLPGVVCALMGDSAACLLWFGACALMGWAAAIVFRAIDRSDRLRTTD